MEPEECSITISLFVKTPGPLEKVLVEVMRLSRSVRHLLFIAGNCSLNFLVRRVLFIVLEIFLVVCPMSCRISPQDNKSLAN